MDNKQESYIRKINSASTSLLAIINDILDYSKIEAGILADVAPTLLSIMNVERPAEMTGKVLV